MNEFAVTTISFNVTLCGIATKLPSARKSHSNGKWTFPNGYESSVQQEFCQT